MYAPALDTQFARDVRAGLTRAGQKTLPCSYLYDDAGSALFEAITHIPEYGLTRADARILNAHAEDLIGRLPRNVVVAELGSGTGIKTRPLLEKLGRRQSVIYYPIDVSGMALEKCTLELGRLGKVFPLETGYLEGMREVVRKRTAGQTLLVLFLGSTIGNFEPEAANDFLRNIHQLLAPGDALLLGTDLIKPVERMVAAYDDPIGVSAAFNLNLLARINRELDADFEIRQFEHEIRYITAAQRIEMHLRSRTHQTVSIRRADLTVDFTAGETIFTEACHKFLSQEVREMAIRTGFRVDAQWIDKEWPFAENLLIAV